MSEKNFNIHGVNIDTKVLISTVRNYPILWNHTLKGYKSTKNTNKIWKEVAVLVGFEEKDIDDKIIKEFKKMFKAQKDKYRNEHRKVMNESLCSGSEGFSGYKSKWPYYTLCGFLNDIIAAPNNDTEDTFNENIIEETVDTEPESEVTIERSMTYDNIEQPIEFEKPKMKTVENLIDVRDKTRTSDLQFLQSLRPYFRGLDIIENIELKNEIMKCVTIFYKQRRSM